MTTEVESARGAPAVNSVMRAPALGTVSTRACDGRVNLVIRMAAVGVLVSVLALIKADTILMVVVVDAKEMATRHLMTLVMKTGGRTGIEEAVVVRRGDVEEVTMNLRETIAIQEAGQCTRGSSS